MLAELASRIDAQKRWVSEDESTLHELSILRNYLEAFLDNGTQHKVSPLKDFFLGGNITYREIDVEVKGDEHHLKIYSKRLDPREYDIYIGLYNKNRSRYSEVAIPTYQDFINGEFLETAEEMIIQIDKINEDILPLIKSQVELDWANKAGLVHGDL